MDSQTHLEILDMREEFSQGGFSIGFVDSIQLCPGEEPGRIKNCRYTSTGSISCLNSKLPTIIRCPILPYVLATVLQSSSSLRYPLSSDQQYL